MDRRAFWFLRPFGLLAAILLAAFAGVGPGVLASDTPGNNGTVKIHEGAGETEPGEVRNEPHVCTFHLHFYFADPEQAGTWEIQQWAPTGQKGTVVLSGTYDTAGDGEDRQPEEGTYTLPDGHYKLFWDGDLDTGKHDKMKVFWVDCAAPTQGQGASEAPVESASTQPNTPPSTAPSTAPSTTPSSAASAAPGGEELPAEGSPPPNGAVLGLTATPPPTDTEAPSTPSDGGWRLALIGLAAFIAAGVLMLPRPASVRSSTTRRPR
jgi:hypothetical protein